MFWELAQPWSSQTSISELFHFSERKSFGGKDNPVRLWSQLSEKEKQPYIYRARRVMSESCTPSSSTSDRQVNKGRKRSHSSSTGESGLNCAWVVIIGPQCKFRISTRRRGVRHMKNRLKKGQHTEFNCVNITFDACNTMFSSKLGYFVSFIV